MDRLLVWLEEVGSGSERWTMGSTVDLSCYQKLVHQSAKVLRVDVGEKTYKILLMG